MPPAANAAEVPSLYVNNVEVLSISTIEVRLGFNKIAVEGKNGTTERKANIVMSVPHFIAMTNMFNASATSLTSDGHGESAQMEDDFMPLTPRSSASRGKQV